MEMKKDWIDISTIGGERGREDFQSGWHRFAGRLYSAFHIIDVGAGLGKSRARLENGVNRVTLQDVAPGLAVDISTSVDSIPDASYDVVTCFDVIEHVPNDVEFVKHLLRIAKHSVFISTPNYHLHKCTHKYHCREYTTEELAKFGEGRISRYFCADHTSVEERSLTDFVSGKDVPNLAILIVK